VQFTAQRGLIDDPGGFGFVIQRGAINRDQVAVGAGLPVGDDDVGMQVRIDPSPKFANAMLRTTNPSISAGATSGFRVSDYFKQLVRLQVTYA
jgi:hypothetical protein